MGDQPYAKLHQTIYIIACVLLGALIFFSMVVMPIFVFRFGWGYKP